MRSEKEIREELKRCIAIKNKLDPNEDDIVTKTIILDLKWVLDEI